MAAAASQRVEVEAVESVHQRVGIAVLVQANRHRSLVAEPTALRHA